MNCALELITLKEIATKEWELEQKRKDAEAAEKYRAMCEDTIQLCETSINDSLTERAIQRRPLSVSYKVKITTDRLGNDIFSFIRPDGRKYANGDLSYAPSKTYYSVDILKEYLAKHCIALDTRKDWYDCYGMGSLSCTYIKIYVPKP